MFSCNFLMIMEKKDFWLAPTQINQIKVLKWCFREIQYRFFIVNFSVGRREKHLLHSRILQEH